MHSARVAQALVGDDDGVLGQQRNLVHVARPDNVLDRWCGELGNGAALLHIKEDDLVLAAAQQQAGARIEERVRGGVGRGALLGDLVAEVLDLDLAIALVQHRKAVARDKHRRAAHTALGVRRIVPATGVFRHTVQLVRAALAVVADQDAGLGRVVRKAARGLAADGGARAADGDQGVVALRVVLIRAQVSVLDVVQHGAVRRIRGSLALQLEHNHSAVVAGRQQVDLRVGAKDPKPVMLATEGLHAIAL
mmetsp:Transcript_31726/g.82116  ORF Transcript_31726/g.82116 Transcript_31726/m.82116 type:complete len:250 (+) Transcript_31726:2369-3118(+)